jgi:PPP family 3-phenylpropionic acid transporter
VLDQSIDAIVWLYSLDMFLLGLVTLSLPDAPITHKANWREGVTLLKREPILATFLFGILLVGMTLGVVNQYLAVYLEDIHATGWIIGLAMALSALPEVPLMALVPKMLARWGLALVLSGGVAVLPVRWLLYTIIDEPLLVIPTQLLHGIALTALIVVGVIYVDRQLARHWRATGQALYAAMLYGIGPSLGLFAAGFLYERVGIVPLWFFCALVGTAGLMVMAWAVRAPTPGQITERSRL